MASVDLIASCLDSIRQIGDEIVDSIVYVDAGTLEAFQFIGAFPLLLELGARAVCSLEKASPLDVVADWHSIFSHPVRKIVVLTSRLLSDAHRYILRCLGNHGTVSHCTVLTTISETGHSAYVDSPLGPDAFREYETLLIQDHEELFKKYEKSDKHKDNIHYTGGDLTSDADKYSKWDSGVHYGPNSESSPTKRNLFHGDLGQVEASGKRMSVTVCHFPMIFSPISSRAFVLPSESIVADSCLSNQHEDSLGPGLPSISTGKPFDSDEVPPGVTLTAQFLYHLANKMDLKLDIFSFGDTSKVVGKLMMDMSSLYDVGRNKRSAGLLIIDRTVDLLTPCFHGDSFLDRMLSSLPRKERMSSYSVAKNTQTPSKHAEATIKCFPLNIKVPLETLFNKEEPKSRTSMLSEGIMSFVSGWNSAEVDSGVTWLPDYADKANDDKIGSELGSLSGSLLSNYAGVRYLEALIDRGANDGLILIKKWLIEALQHEKLSSASRGRQGAASVSEFRSMVQMLSRDQLSLLRNRGVILLALAAEMTLQEPPSSRWDAFTSAERILSVTSAETTQSLASELRDFINTSTSVESLKQANTMETSQGLLSFQDVLLLTIIGYILAGENFPTSIAGGPFSWEDERSLKDVVVNSILERPLSVKLRFLDGLDNELEAKARSKDGERNNMDSTEPASSTDDFDDEWGNWDENDNTDHQKEDAYGDMQLKLEVRDRVDQLFNFFHKLSSMRLRNQALGEGLAALSRFETDGYSRKCLLYKLLLALLSRYDVPGLEYHSSAVGRLFKSGLGRFGLGQSKPSFGDQSVLIVFVLGGINTLEVREVMTAISESNRPDVELILGGTTLLTPDDMFELLLGSSSFT
ncbi:sec1 family domain-containing protein MIP3-like [Phragmites australis]|uniref:sec1 family domain-containing protein MIP3-like n=1 Tax=Phragmites australis TaxID=29695 RepID=UPI002D773575|nr:sec1 family domain-containing protein MIP3-like [Phragmites australis]